MAYLKLSTLFVVVVVTFVVVQVHGDKMLDEIGSMLCSGDEGKSTKVTTCIGGGGDAVGKVWSGCLDEAGGRDTLCDGDNMGKMKACFGRRKMEIIRSKDARKAMGIKNCLKS